MIVRCEGCKGSCDCAAQNHFCHSCLTVFRWDIEREAKAEAARDIIALIENRITAESLLKEQGFLAVTNEQKEIAEIIRKRFLEAQRILSQSADTKPERASEFHNSAGKASIVVADGSGEDKTADSSRSDIPQTAGEFDAQDKPGKRHAQSCPSADTQDVCPCGHHATDHEHGEELGCCNICGVACGWFTAREAKA